MSSVQGTRSYRAHQACMSFCLRTVARLVETCEQLKLSAPPDVSMTCVHLLLSLTFISRQPPPLLLRLTIA